MASIGDIDRESFRLSDDAWEEYLLHVCDRGGEWLKYDVLIRFGGLFLFVIVFMFFVPAHVTLTFVGVGLAFGFIYYLCYVWGSWSWWRARRREKRRVTLDYGGVDVGAHEFSWSALGDECEYLIEVSCEKGNDCDLLDIEYEIPDVMFNQKFTIPFSKSKRQLMEKYYQRLEKGLRESIVRD